MNVELQHSCHVLRKIGYHCEVPIVVTNLQKKEIVDDQEPKEEVRYILLIGKRKCPVIHAMKINVNKIITGGENFDTDPTSTSA